MRRLMLAGFALIAALLLAAGPAYAQYDPERILDYHSDIAISVDGSMKVAERITVMVTGVRIHHGIYRDFPTDYRDAGNNRLHVDLKVLGATRDGQPEDWHIKRMSNGQRIYLGGKDRVVSSGKHSYVLTYLVTREIGFLPDHDELFWNVNGSGWIFPIDTISADVSLPVAVPVAKLGGYGYTGAKGSSEQALTVTLRDGGAHYAATRALGSHENLSILLAFPKGIVTEPDSMQKVSWFLRDNRAVLYGLIGLALLWIYYILAWRTVGRDPATGPQVAIYAPPQGDSAAALRYVRQMDYDNICFTAGILGIAAKGGLSIRQWDDDDYEANRTDLADPSVLSVDEITLRDMLFMDSPKLVFEREQRKRIKAARKAHEETLERLFRKKYFRSNGWWLLPGLAIVALTAWVMMQAGGGSVAFRIMFTLVALGIVLVPRADDLFGLWLDARGIGKAGWRQWSSVLGLIVMAGIILFYAGNAGGYALLPVLIGLIATTVFFYLVLRAPTPLGAKLLAHIQGFRWYLGVAEKQELDSRYRPESNPTLFSTYLPYALALGVDNAWADRFARALTPAQFSQAQPTWYSGSYGGYSGFTGASLAGFTSSLSSGLGGAIASSGAAPGSGGGGFSGGGGGGGGGGGW